MANYDEPEFAAKSHTGMVRSHNEDAISVNPANRFAILADGMGGYNAGEVASAIAIAVIEELLETRLKQGGANALSYSGKGIRQLITESVDSANRAILTMAQGDAAYNGMGTTLVLAMLHKEIMVIAHIGDSRAYRLRQGKLDQITRDHSVLQDQIDSGLISPEMAQFSPNRHLITRAVGVDPQVETEIHEHPVEPGDIYLLCSDGLSDMLTAEEISAVFEVADASLEANCNTLIDRANANGGRDNVSAILIKIQSSQLPKDGLIKRILNWTK